MAALYVTEFVELEQGPARRVGQMSMQPPVAEQTVAIGGSSAQSNAFNALTRIVRVHTDSICSIEFGTNPTATATTARMAANQTEYFGVPVNQSYKIAVI